MALCETLCYKKERTRNLKFKKCSSKIYILSLQFIRVDSKMNKTGIISWKGFHWEYFVYGNGPEYLFAFHGFDNDAVDFSCFEKALGKRYTIVAINLFFHGKSFSEKGVYKPGFSEKDLNELFNRFLIEFNCTRFSLLGFSLGGRIVLQLTIAYAERINRVFLLAPDGLKISRWYRFVTHWRIGRRLFKRVVVNPNNFFAIAGFFRKLRLVGAKQYKFALGNFDTKEKREKVYNVWMIFRNILPDPYIVKVSLDENQVILHLVFGAYDTIIPSVWGKKFSKGLDTPVTFDVLEMGHNLLKEKVAEELYRLITDNKKDADRSQHLA